MKNPATPDEWRDAIRAAVFSLGLDAAEKYGLVDGPGVDIQRAESIISAGAELGYEIPTLDQVLADDVDDGDEVPY